MSTAEIFINILQIVCEMLVLLNSFITRPSKALNPVMLLISHVQFIHDKIISRSVKKVLLLLGKSYNPVNLELIDLTLMY